MVLNLRDDLLIDQPLVLVSEIQRSGGSMTAQLFDGHPELFAHPGEIQIGFPQKWVWPELDLQAEPESWLERLHERRTDIYIKNGFSKPDQNTFAAQETFPFLFDKDVQKSVFVEMARQRGVRKNRDVLDCYFTSYFRAWSNYPITGREKFVTGFTPRVNMIDRSREGFFRDYPDGKLISLVRDPRSWWASTRKHDPDPPKLKAALGLWQQSATTVKDMMQMMPDRFLPLIFEDLVTQPEAEMRKVAKFIGIAFEPSLLEPTYLGIPVMPNSAFDVNRKGINPEMAKRAALLDATDLAYIEKAAVPFYEGICRDARIFGRRYT
jgi:hypothetical protein